MSDLMRKNNLVLKVNDFYLSGIYTKDIFIKTDFIGAIDFNVSIQKATHYNFDEAIKLIDILCKYFKDIEIESDEDYEI